MLIAPFALLLLLTDSSLSANAAVADADTPAASDSLRAPEPRVVAVQDPDAPLGADTRAADRGRAWQPVPALGLGSAAAGQGGGRRGRDDNGLRFLWREHPSLRSGRWLRLDFSTKVQEDTMRPGDSPVPFDDTVLRRARIGVDGELFRIVQFSVERELTTTEQKATAQSSKTQWRDVYGELNVADGLQIRGGRFKIPFSRDQLDGEGSNNFVFRSLGGDYLAPGRDIGGMVHGRFYKRALNYWAGIFEHDGDNSRSNKQAGGDRTIAARLTGTPFRRFGRYHVDRIEIGGNGAWTDVNDASPIANGLRARTVISQYDFFEPVFVRGTRTRYGTDAEWAVGPVGGRGEYMYVAEQRDHQGLRGDTVPDAHARAWYASGQWVLTGEQVDRNVIPKHPLLMGGAGAFELAARYERIWFNSESTGQPAFSNSRAEVILPSGEKVLTLGLNWYMNRWVKVQGNALREQLEDAGRTPLADGGTHFWSFVARLQFQL